MITRASTMIIAAVWSLAALAGPITPPPGPVASTHKTLTEVEPRIAISFANTPGDADSIFKITEPGSYYLTGNIAGASGKHGIEIVASGVTLDLNGFDLLGKPGMGAFDGVSATAVGLTNIAIINGSVREWGGRGIDLASPSTQNSRVERVEASGNGGSGIAIGVGSMISHCSVSRNANIVSESAIIIGSGSTITNCSASSNDGAGITTGPGCIIESCTAYLNADHGISTNAGCTITGCSAADNGGDGILTSAGCSIASSSSYSNNADGIRVGAGCTVADCTVRFNSANGIQCPSDCTIRANTCASNGVIGVGAGILVTGTENRIEANTCTDTDRGIDVDGSGNIIIRNTCASNTTDWSIAANNVVGPVLDRRAPTSAAFSGFSYPGSLGSADPNANFSY